MSTAVTATAAARHRLRAGMVGMGMIFDETYRPFFEQAHAVGVAFAQQVLDYTRGS